MLLFLLAVRPAAGQLPLARVSNFSTMKVTEYQPIFSLKTNMLYNMALTPNVAAEVAIGKRWSISAGFMRGWWLEREWSFCWQVEAAELEARYWMRRNEKQPVQTGWFVGAFASSGFFDVQLESAKGVQGELTAMGGLTGGYALPLGQSWRVELTAGAGYLLSSYRRYTVERADGSQTLVKSGPNRRLNALYPIKAGILLVWSFNRKAEWVVDKKNMDKDAVDEPEPPTAIDLDTDAPKAP
ncbi:MAG: DUF3575 domain-containing protein [Prevotellaceae bacterium]|nr:DUF3575 domain-containing protein [Prevotellaceae bacterium]